MRAEVIIKTVFIKVIKVLYEGCVFCERINAYSKNRQIILTLSRSIICSSTRLIVHANAQKKKTQKKKIKLCCKFLQSPILFKSFGKKRTKS
jgi:predicted translin family RNA/ssDNA-binding protein